MEDADDKNEKAEEGDEGDEPIVAFFRSLTAAARRDYETLAERDRRFGEDIAAEVRS